MASSYKYFSDRDRVVVTNPLIEDVQSDPEASGWSERLEPPYYFTQYATGSDFATNPRIFDVTTARSSVTIGTGEDLNAQHNIYNQLAKVLLGHNADNKIKQFSLDPDDTSDNYILHNAFFINFARTQFKDKIRQGSVSLKFNVSGAVEINLVDSGSTGTAIRECAAGNYGTLFVTASSAGGLGGSFVNGSTVAGLVFYEAGIAVVSPYIFSQQGTESNPSNTNNDLNKNVRGLLASTAPTLGTFGDVKNYLSGALIYDCNSAFIKGLGELGLKQVKYQAITELNSTIYFCRAYNHEFNYSSNPTYLNNSEIVVKGGDPEVPPRAYITTVGLYSDDNQLLAVAKLSEPLLKTNSNELIARIRLDF